MRILALDVGKRRIGIAVSDPMGITARPHSTIERNRLAPRQICALVDELEAGTIVVGLPLHLSGSEGEQAKDVRSFVEKLAPLVGSISIEFWDERFTTLEARERLAAQGRDRRKNREKIDAFAAALILESYLNRK